MAQQLLPHIVAAYSDPDEDRIVTNNPSETRIRIDDRKPKDAPSVFCHIGLTFFLGDKCVLRLTNAPITDEIRDLVRSRGGFARGPSGVNAISVILTAADAPFIEQLAAAIRRAIETTAEQPNYRNPNWKWICPRTATSLERFARVLQEFCNSQDQLQPEPKPMEEPQS
jgi:hypothetical protein